MIPPSRPSPTLARIPVDSPTAQSSTTDRLIESCFRGDQSAWDEIVHTYRRRVFNVAYKFVGRHEEAEDLSQEIFLKLYRALHTFDRRANFQTWLISISRNLCIDHYRSVRREREPVDRNVDAADLSPPPLDRTRSPGCTVATDETCFAAACSRCRTRSGQPS